MVKTKRAEKEEKAMMQKKRRIPPTRVEESEEENEEELDDPVIDEDPDSEEEKPGKIAIKQETNPKVIYGSQTENGEMLSGYPASPAREVEFGGLNDEDCLIKVKPWPGKGQLANVLLRNCSQAPYTEESPLMRITDCVLHGDGMMWENSKKDLFYLRGIPYNDDAERGMEDINNKCRSLLRRALQNPDVMANWKTEHPGCDPLHHRSVEVGLPCKERNGQMELYVTRPVYLRNKDYNRISWVDRNGDPLKIGGVLVEDLPRERAICSSGAVVRAAISYSAFFFDEVLPYRMVVKLEFLGDLQLCSQNAPLPAKLAPPKPRFSRFEDAATGFF